jgi:hypothetical protein
MLFIKDFIIRIHEFLETDFCKAFLTETALIKLKSELTCEISEDTKNYVFLAWLRKFLVEF